MRQPAVEAANAIIQVMTKGSMKEGCNEKWRERDVKFHIMKSISHNLRALQLLEGHIIDAETVLEHVERSLTRDAMAMTVLLEG